MAPEINTIKVRSVLLSDSGAQKQLECSTHLFLQWFPNVWNRCGSHIDAGTNGYAGEKVHGKSCQKKKRIRHGERWRGNRQSDKRHDIKQEIANNSWWTCVETLN